MTKTVRTWVVSAIAILIAIIGGYYSLQGSSDSNTHKHGGSAEQQEEGEHDHANHHPDSDPDVTIDVNVTYTDETLMISMLNQEREAPELAVTHEKLMHLILISDDLETFIHLHPEQTEEGEFVVTHSLDHTSYQVFIDIKPVNDVYVTKPIPLDTNDHHKHNQLQVDHDMVKVVAGIEVELSHDPIKAGQPVTLIFDMKNALPEPYLGALGHVVIVDEHLSTFIHVHPESTNETMFEAHFEHAGIYKLWAEFKVNGEVHTFPYIIEVE